MEHVAENQMNRADEEPVYYLWDLDRKYREGYGDGYEAALLDLNALIYGQNLSGREAAAMLWEFLNVVTKWKDKDFPLAPTMPPRWETHGQKR